MIQGGRRKIQIVLAERAAAAERKIVSKKRVLQGVYRRQTRENPKQSDTQPKTEDEKKLAREGRLITWNRRACQPTTTRSGCLGGHRLAKPMTPTREGANTRSLAPKTGPGGEMPANSGR